jgi:hypothetical protein
MRGGISRKAVQISPHPSAFILSRACRSSGGFSLVVTTVQSTARKKTTAPMVNATCTVWGIGCPGPVSLPTPPIVWSHSGNFEAITAPAPMKTDCMANPTVRCCSGSRSATNARKGSMLMLTEASRIQSRPAAIHSTDECGMARRARLEQMAPTKKYGRLRPSAPHVRSLMWPINGCTSKPVTGAASQSRGSSLSLAPRYS